MKLHTSACPTDPPDSHHVFPAHNQQVQFGCPNCDTNHFLTPPLIGAHENNAMYCTTTCSHGEVHGILHVVDRVSNDAIRYRAWIRVIPHTGEDDE